MHCWEIKFLMLNQMYDRKHFIIAHIKGKGPTQRHIDRRKKGNTVTQLLLQETALHIPTDLMHIRNKLHCYREVEDAFSFLVVMGMGGIVFLHTCASRTVQ